MQCAHLGKGVAQLGEPFGDVTRAHLSRAVDADGVISGPPRPPFSSIGKDGGRSGPRSDVRISIVT
eukprot:7843796-Pyramimonas_sp.AAC.1